MLKRSVLPLAAFFAMLAAAMAGHDVVAAANPAPLPSGDCFGYYATRNSPGYVAGHLYASAPAGGGSAFVKVAVQCVSIPTPAPTVNPNATPSPVPTPTPVPTPIPTGVVSLPLGVAIPPGKPGSFDASGFAIATDFGACTGGADDRSALQLAGAIAGRGGVVLLPEECNFNGTLKITTGYSLRGLGEYQTIITDSCKTCDVVQIGDSTQLPLGAGESNGTQISNLAISCTNSPTSGSAVHFDDGAQDAVRDVYIVDCWNGVRFGENDDQQNDVQNDVVDHLFTQGIANASIEFAGQGGGFYVTHSELTGTGNVPILTGSNPNPKGSAGFEFDGSIFVNVDPLYATDDDIEGTARGIVADFTSPTASASLTDTFFTNIISDAPFEGIEFNAAGPHASITRLKLTNMWSTITPANSNTNPGMMLECSAGGTLTDFQVVSGNYTGPGGGIRTTGTGCNTASNSTNGSIEINGIQSYLQGGPGVDVGLDGVAVKNSHIGTVYNKGNGVANSQCVVFRATATNSTAQGNDCRGNDYTKPAIQVYAGATHIAVKDNDVRGYDGLTTTVLPIEVDSTNAVADDIIVRNNSGFNSDLNVNFLLPAGTNYPAFPASGTPFTNSLSFTLKCYVALNGATNFSGSSNGVPTGSLVLLDPGESWTPSYTGGPPTWECIPE